MKPSFAVLFLLGTAAAPSAFAQGTVQTSAQVVVEAANAEPLSTGLTVGAGRLLVFTVSGTWCLSGTPPTAECGPPSGIRPAGPLELPPILGTAEFGALIGRVPTGPWFEIGAGGAVRVPNAGTLTLLFNDCPSCYPDNSGSVSVGISPVAPPSFVWAKSLGGVDSDILGNLALDAGGNVYTTGSFSGTADFDPGSGTRNLTATIRDVFVSKLNSSGAFVWARKIGGGGLDVGDAIAVDRDGNTYVAGFFEQTADFDPGPGVFNLTAVGGRDLFVIKLDDAGRFVWAKRVGGQIFEFAADLALDQAANVYMVGAFRGTVDFNPGPGTKILTSNGQTGFVLKLDGSGNFGWVRKVGGPTGADSVARGVGLDGLGNVYVVGGEDDVPTLFRRKLDRDGNAIWFRSLPATPVAMAVDATGNLYDTGTFVGTVDFNPGPGTFELTSAGLRDIFLAKTDSAGRFLWARRIGAEGEFGRALDIATEASGDVYYTGDFFTTLDFNPGSRTRNLTPEGNGAAFVLRLNRAGAFVWAAKIDGFSIEEGIAIAVDGMRNVHTAGIFQGRPDFNPGAGTFSVTARGRGRDDIFVTKWSQP